MDASTIGVLAASAVATIFIWRQIYRSVDPVPMKWALAVVAAIPIIGPLFWPFLSMPPRRPEMASSRPFQGPLSQLPSQPRWLAISYRILIGVIAAGVMWAHWVIFGVITN
jgi:hypothetical protein